MRVLHVVDRLSERGGAYSHLNGMIAHQARDTDVHLAFGRDDGSVSPPCSMTPVPGLDARVRAHVDLAPLVRDVRPDVVHVHTIVNPEALEQLGHMTGVAKIITVQDHRYFCPGRGKWTEDDEVCIESMTAELCTKCFADDDYYREILGLTRARCEALAPFRVVVLSRYMKRELEAAGVANITVIPPFVHGLDPDAPPDGPPCVLFVGRLVAAKGVLDAVEAWKRAAVELPLVIAGSGPLREEIEGCDVLGWVPREKLSALYRRAAVVIMPSRWQEPFGIVGLEALTMGVPVVAWNSGGVSEWHGEAGLVRWGDVEALANELKLAVGRRAVPPRGYDPKTLMSSLTALYRECSWGSIDRASDVR